MADNNMDAMLTSWRNATAALPWGAQRVLHETLSAVKDNGVHLVHGADYRGGKPCLINAAGSMLVSGGGKGIPTRHFGSLVGLFDRINKELVDRGINDSTGYVSPLAAEILLRNFAPLKDVPEEASLANVSLPDAPYVEPSDEEIMADFLKAAQAPAPSELYEPATDPVDGFNKDYIKSQVHHGIFGN